MTVLYKGVEFSPRTFLTAAIEDTDPQDFVLDNIDAVPDLLPDEYGYLVMSKSRNFTSDDPDDYEVIKFTTKDDLQSLVGGVTRGVAGLAQTWDAGSWCACTIGNLVLSEIIAAVNGKLDAPDGVIQIYTEEVKVITGTGTLVLDLDEANVFKVTINADVATELNIDNIRAGAHSWVVYLIQHAGEPAITIDFGVPVEWPDDTVPELAVGLNKLVFDTIDEGTTIYGQLVGQNYGDGS